MNIFIVVWRFYASDGNLCHATSFKFVKLSKGHKISHVAEWQWFHHQGHFLWLTSLPRAYRLLCSSLLDVVFYCFVVHRFAFCRVSELPIAGDRPSFFFFFWESRKKCFWFIACPHYSDVPKFNTLHIHLQVTGTSKSALLTTSF